MVIRELGIGLLRFGERDECVRGEIFGDGLSFAGGPGHFDAGDLFRIAEAEIKGHDAVAEIAGFAIVHAVLRFPAGGERDAGSDGVAI